MASERQSSRLERPYMDRDDRHGPGDPQCQWMGGKGAWRKRDTLPIDKSFSKSSQQRRRSIKCSTLSELVWYSSARPIHRSQGISKMLRLPISLIPEPVFNGLFVFTNTVHPIPSLILHPHPSRQERRNNYHRTVTHNQARKR
jgi:hypothetical protein